MRLGPQPKLKSLAPLTQGKRQGKRQLTTTRPNQTTGLTNDRAANWVPEVVFSPFRALSRRQLTSPFCYNISQI